MKKEQQIFPPLNSKELFPELHEAISKGYHHCFGIHPDGSLRCKSNTSKHYELDEVHIEFITCLSNKATIYLITTHDGFFKGVLVDYWEC